MKSLALIALTRALTLAAAGPLATSCAIEVDESQSTADAGDSLEQAAQLIWPIEAGVSSFVTQSAARSGEPFPCGSGVNAQHILQGQHGDNHDYEHSLDIVARNRGLDAAAVAFEGRGTDVVATADGIVVSVSSVQSECDRDLGAGNYVLIEHPQLEVGGEPVFSAYMHLNSSADIEAAHDCTINPAPMATGSFEAPHVGELVHAGQKIGELGNTGNSTGTHLHFQFAAHCQLSPADSVDCPALPALAVSARGFSKLQVQRDASCASPMASGGPAVLDLEKGSYLSDGSYVTSRAPTMFSQHDPMRIAAR